MAPAPLTPPSSEEAAQALAAARDWSGWLYTVIGGLFGGGVIWGTLRSTIKEHALQIAENKLRIEAVEKARSDLGDKIGARIDELRVEMQAQHNGLMRVLLDIARGRKVSED